MDEAEEELARKSHASASRGGTGTSTGAAARAGASGGGGGGGAGPPELSAVLDSLHKLAELESRISHLEKDNQVPLLPLLLGRLTPPLLAHRISPHCD